MSEEKIMNIVKGKLLMINKMLEQDQEEGHGSAYEMQAEDFEAIQGLLDLYNKEKAKNKELYDKGYKEGLTKTLQPQILENWKKSNANIIKIKSQFVSKDKIKEKVIEVKNRTVKDDFITATQGKLNTIIDLEDLLGG